MIPELDNFDRRILAIMQTSNRVGSERIASEVGLSAAAVQRRLKRMRAEGTIKSDVSVLDPIHVGRKMSFVVQVSLERERVDLLDAFKTQMRAEPAVQQCYYVTGSADFVLIVTAKDMADFECFTRVAFFDNKNIRHFETNVVMDAVKIGLQLPLPIQEAD